MQKIYTSLIIAALATALSIVLFIATRKQGIGKNKKYAIYAAIMAIIAASSGYYIFLSPSKNESEQVSQKINTSQEKGSTENISSSESESEDIYGDKLEMQRDKFDREYRLNFSERIGNLRQTEEWKNFAALWHDIDYAEFLMENYENEMGLSGAKDQWVQFTIGRIFFETLDARKNVAIGALKKIPEKQLIAAEEINLLDRLCENRLNYLYAPYDTPTRMAATAFRGNEYDQNKIMATLEGKIDILIELRKQEKIDEARFQEALTLIKEDIKISALLDVISENYQIDFNIESETITMDNINQLLSDLKSDASPYQQNQQSASKNTVDARQNATLTAIKKTEATLVNFNELVDALEN